jgi:hypothetical protein
VTQLTWSQSADLSRNPVEIVSLSDGGVEGVYQSSAVIPVWHVTADENGRWDVWICRRLARSAAVNSLCERGSLLTGAMPS